MRYSAKRYRLQGAIAPLKNMRLWTHLFPLAVTPLNTTVPATAEAYTPAPETCAELFARTDPEEALKDPMPSRNNPPPLPSVISTALLPEIVAEVRRVEMLPVMNIPAPKAAVLSATCAMRCRGKSVSVCVVRRDPAAAQATSGRERQTRLGQAVEVCR